MDQDVNTNVVLTADTSQYDRSFQQSAAQTDMLSSSIDTLTQKIDSLTKSAGRKLVTIGAVDIAGITAATIAYGAWEKQMSQLNSQAAVLTKTVTGHKQLFKSYADDVDQLRRHYGLATSEAQALEQTLTKMSDHTTTVSKLGDTFGKLAKATGETTTGLSTSMLQLQKVMGSPQKNTEMLSNQLVTLQKRSNATAGAILDFASNIAPVARAAGVGTTDLLGFSNAFIKAGQDGYQASTVFNKMLTDVTNAAQTGSPDLAKYANLVGMTTENFKQLGSTDKVIRFFDAINRQGPQTLTTLNRLGYDGARTIRTMTALAAQGGIQSEINAARGAPSDTLSKGAAAGGDTIVAQLQKFRAQIAQTAEAIGEAWAGPAKLFLKSLTLIASGIREVADSPLGKLLGWVTGAGGAFAVLAGSILLAAKALSTFALANMALRGAGMRGFQETAALTAAQRAEMQAMGMTPGSARANAQFGGRTAGQVAGPGGSWTGRAIYGGGGLVANMLGRTADSAGPGFLSRAAGYGATGVGGTARFIGQALYSGGAVHIPGVAGSGGYNDPTQRMRLFNSQTIGGSFAGPFGALGRGVREGWQGAAGRLAFMGTPYTAAQYDQAQKINEKYNAVRGANPATTDARAQAAAIRSVERQEQAARSLANVEKSAMTASRGMTNLGKGIGNALMMIGATGVGAVRTVSGLLGGMGPMMGLMAGFAAYQVNDAYNKEQFGHVTDQSGFLSPYYQKAGVTAPPSSSYAYGAGGTKAPVKQTTASALQITESEARSVAKGMGYKLTNKSLAGKTQKAAQAWLSTQWASFQKSPDLLNSAVMDLVNLFGQGDAQRIIANLQAGGGDQVPVFARQAAEPGYSDSTAKRVWGFVRSPNPFKGMQSGEKTSDQWDDFFGALNAQTAQLAMTVGPDKAQVERGKTIQKGLKEYFANRKQGTEKATINQMAQNLFGIDPKEIDYRSFWSGGYDPEDIRGVKDPMGFIKESFTGGGYADNDAMKKMTGSKYGIKGITTMSDDKLVKAIYDAIFNPKPTEKEDKERRTSEDAIRQYSAQIFQAGGVLGSAAMQKALTTGSADVNAQYQAINEVANKIVDSSPSFQKQSKTINKLVSLADGVDMLGAQQFAGARAQIGRYQGFQMPYMNRTEQFGVQVGQYQAAMQTPLSHGFTREDKQAAEDTFQQQVMAQYDYFKQMLYQQREFNVQRKRAEEDYSLQRAYSYADFARMRARAEYDFNLQRARAEAEFTRSMRRNRTDFDVSRKRQEQDYHHQVMLMVEQQAKALYNIYERVEVKRTSSASWLLVNARDQLTRMQDQEANLQKLRKMGMTDDAIQQMGFNDVANAQQLGRFVTEATSNPALVKEFNATVRKRLAAAKKLVTDESSQEWEEFNRSYKLARDRAQEDFEKSVKRARQDFKRSLHEQNDDFQRSLSRQQQDFAIGMDRQAVAYKKSMDRSAADLARSAKTIDGNFEDILTKAATRLGGHAAKQAKVVINQFRDLKESTDPAAIAIMRSLAAIFGVKYKAPDHLPKIPNLANIVTASGGGPKGPTATSQFAGGVLPGYSPGIDNIKFRSPEGHELNLSGGESIMVPEWTKRVGGAGKVAEMNRRARGHSFAGGGEFKNPDARVYMDGEPVSAISKAQLLLAERLSHKNLTTMQGSWQPHTTYSGSSHMGPGVVDESPGNFDTQYWMRRVAFAAWGRNFPGAASAGSGAHVHGVSRVDPGARNHPQLSSFARGEDGLGGKDYGPNPSVLPGLMGLLNQFGPLLLASGGPGGGSMIPSFGSITKDIYPKVEAAVARFSAVQPLGRDNMSHIINAFAKVKYDQWKKKYGDTMFDGVSGVSGGAGGGSGGTETGALAMGKRMAAQYGWTGRNWSALKSLWNAESGWNYQADNPTSSAYGIPQALVDLHGIGKPYWGRKTGSGANSHYYGGDPATQISWGLNYIKGRYGSPSGAWDYWQKNHSYGDGAIFGQGAQAINVGERGPEMVLPLNDRGVSFLSDLMNKLSVGREGQLGHLTGSVPKMGIQGMTHNYQIDRSTNFTGPITVEAQNPAELIHKLRQRNLVTALSQASLGGTRL